MNEEPQSKRLPFWRGVGLLVLLANLGCGSPAEPELGEEGEEAPSDPFYAALVDRLEVISAPGADPVRRAAEQGIYQALIELFESSGGSGP